jgi:hypothetical protein
MKTIFTYSLEGWEKPDQIYIALPEGAIALSVRVYPHTFQRPLSKMVILYALVETTNTLTTRAFCILKSGDISQASNLAPIGILDPDNALGIRLHAFEIIQE